MWWSTMLHGGPPWSRLYNEERGGKEEGRVGRREGRREGGRVGEGREGGRKGQE